MAFRANRFHGLLVLAACAVSAAVVWPILAAPGKDVSGRSSAENQAQGIVPSASTGGGGEEEAPASLRLVLRLDFQKAARRVAVAEEVSSREKRVFLENTAAVLGRRLGAKAKVRMQGEDRILVEVPRCGEDETESLRALVTRPGRFELRFVLEGEMSDLDFDAERRRLERWLAEPRNQALVGPDPGEISVFNSLGPGSGGPRRPDLVCWVPVHQDADPNRSEVSVPIEWRDACGEPRRGPARFMACLPAAAPFSGKDLQGAEGSRDDRGHPALAFWFHPKKEAAFGEFTAANIGKPIAVILDDRVRTAPIIGSRLSGPLMLSGGSKGFSSEEVEILVRTLPGGELPIPVVVEEPLPSGRK